jgi:hypothetical protein
MENVLNELYNLIKKTACIRIMKMTSTTLLFFQNDLLKIQYECIIHCNYCRKMVSSKRLNTKKQEVSGIVILPRLVFPVTHVS